MAPTRLSEVTESSCSIFSVFESRSRSAPPTPSIEETADSMVCLQCPQLASGTRNSVVISPPTVPTVAARHRYITDVQPALFQTTETERTDPRGSPSSKPPSGLLPGVLEDPEAVVAITREHVLLAAVSPDLDTPEVVPTFCDVVALL